MNELSDHTGGEAGDGVLTLKIVHTMKLTGATQTKPAAAPSPKESQANSQSSIRGTIGLETDDLSEGTDRQPPRPDQLQAIPGRAKWPEGIINTPRL